MCCYIVLAQTDKERCLSSRRWQLSWWTDVLWQPRLGISHPHRQIITDVVSSDIL